MRSRRSRGLYFIKLIDLVWITAVLAREEESMSTATSVQLDIAPLSGTIGAEIRAIDLHQTLDPRDAGRRPPGPPRLQGHLLPGPHLVPRGAQAVRGLLRRDHPRPPGHPRPRATTRRSSRSTTPRPHPRRRARAGVRRPGELAHRRHLRGAPPLGSDPQRHRDPRRRGDTLWADTQAAYEGLSQPVRQLVDGLTADPRRHPQLRHAPQVVGQGEWDGETFTELKSVEHPVVRTHPETGRRNLFVNPGFTRRSRA